MSKKVQAVVYMTSDEKTNINKHIKEKTEHSSFSSFSFDLLKANLPSELFESLPTNVKPKPKDLVLRTRVNENEYLAFQKRMREEGGKNTSAFLTKIIREYLNSTPHLNDGALSELRSANQSLLAIGRNLNQIVTQIHTGKADGVQITDKYLTRMIDYIDNQRSAIMGMVVFSEHRDISER